MEYKYDDLLQSIQESQCNIKGKWVACRPKGPLGWPGFKIRVRSAWRVLTGKADAFTWPGGQ
ncbi:hypothetical protein AH04_80 [Erwinia phage AH04]|uniref:Uncharacterized protein n=1 Tax=Erwinia phage AH04 TaxID=2869569 RepID=A0AAE7X0T3_9CAUD|nr:hypothetical protein PQC02_gp234 [Erwinia phage AH04]QZA70563.1 hypothetical protein AH04_80 [Erwinia phage AH04]